MPQGRRPQRSIAGELAQSRNVLGRLLIVRSVSQRLLPSGFDWRKSTARTASADDALLQSQLQSGEFSPALATARQLPQDPSHAMTHSHKLRRLKIPPGDHEASFANDPGSIDDDLARADALKSAGNLASPTGAMGGNQADFDSLIELITSTVTPSSWDQNGGVGTVAPFPGGVYVDADGVLQPALNEDRSGAWPTAPSGRRTGDAPAKPADVHHRSPLRKVSLTRLERAVQLERAAGRKPTEAMQLMAGLERIKYVIVYPESHDLVIAGPADDWQTDPEGRIVAKTSNHPIVRLDDLVVVLRYMLAAKDARFGCSITPTVDNLASTKQFVAESSQTPIKVGQRDAWLEQLRSHLGKQTIEVNGIDPRTRVGRVMVEADYRMKLVGLGLEDGVLGVPSYLSTIRLNKDGSVPPLDVLRWWFTLNYNAVEATSGHDAFEIRGQGVKVLSENELLTTTGQQVHTGQTSLLNDQFAHNFTEHFPELAAKYPVYAELQNIFDLALIGALIRSQKLAERADWHLTCFGDPRAYAVEIEGAPRAVDTVINHRVIGGVHILVGVSGGVTCDPSPLIRSDAIDIDYGRLQETRSFSKPKSSAPEIWWWD